MNLRPLFLPVLLIAACLTACNPNASKPLPTVWKVDLQRYMGKWYNVARLPASFQDGCTHSTAVYKMLPDGTVSVVNSCVKDGKVKKVKGTARVVNPKTNAVLEVTFDEWFSAFIPKAPKGNYFVLWLAPDYSAAAVGTPNREYLWILSRSPKLSPATYSQIVKHCQTLGYETDKLIVETQHSKR